MTRFPLILNGSIISKQILDKLKKDIYKNNYKINFTSIIVGDRHDSIKYIKKKKEICKKIGINNKILYLDNDISEYSFASTLDKLNNDSNVHSILIQSPLPKHINSKKYFPIINFKKDVDCFNSSNIGNLFYKNYFIKPCTPAGIIEIFNYYNINYKDKNITILGNSNIVGKPLSILLSNSGATVTTCNINTKNIKYFTKNSDIIISATGNKYLIDSSYIGTNFPIIIDVGINIQDNKIYGDVNFNNIKDKISAITPVPNGVGPMTTSMLMKNIYDLYEKFWIK